MVKKGILLSLLLAAICHGDSVDGLDGIAGSSTMDDIEGWSVVTGSVRSVTNSYGSVGMISAAGSNSLWAAEYVSSDVLQTNTVYGLAVRAGNWSSDPGTGTVFAIAIGYYDAEWHELINKTFTGGAAGEITPTTNGYYETLEFTNALAMPANVAVRVGCIGISGGWGGFDTVSLTILKSDSDGDGLPDRWEFDHGLNPNDDGTVNPDDGAWGDPDHDGLPNDEEYFMGSDPQANESGLPWKSRPEKARLMVISTHPDDEGIFFGGVIPYYTQVRKLPTVVISMTSGIAGETEIHETEFRSACWAYGLRNQPVFPRFYNNVWNATLAEVWDTWADGILDGDTADEGQAVAGETLAYWIRRYRPDVVVTHDLDGEYGHPDHKAVAMTVTNAVVLAADTNNVDGLQPWQVKKLYLHMYPANQLFHDFWQDVSIDTNADTTADITPMDAANTGLAFHIYQGTPTNASTVYAVNETSDAGWEPYPSEWWGLVSSTVGADTETNFIAPDADFVMTNYTGWARGDFFEHIAVFADSDYDQLPDEWEVANGLDPNADDASMDSDLDGLSNLSEYNLGTDPQMADSDSDGLSDSDEENIYFTDPLDPDTDHDGMPDGWEVGFALNPLTTNALSDADGDGLDNASEFGVGTDPTLSDTDGDGLSDYSEIHNVVAWGDNYYRQTVVPSNVLNAVKIAAGGSFGLALLVDGEIVGWGDNYYSQCDAPASATNVTSIAAGDAHALAILSNKAVVAWGDNYYHQCNVPPSATNIVAVAGGIGHSLALRADGHVVAWGSNSHGELDVPLSVTNAVQIAAGNYHGLALLNDGQVIAWGDNTDGACDVPALPTNAVAVAAGGGHSLALLSDGQIVAWGQNDFGQVSVPTNINTAVEIAAGGYHSLAMLADGSLTVWGNPFYGIGTVPSGLKFSHAIDAGRFFSVALKSATDPLDLDSDDDGLSDGDEANTYFTDPLDADTDHDGMPDGWEVSNSLDPISDDAAMDSDSDGLLNLSEYGWGTDPLDADTDRDGMPDGWEVGFALDPLATNALSDTDLDDAMDLYEFAMGGNPTNGLDIGIVPSYTVAQLGGTNYLDFIYARRTNMVALGLSYRLELTDDQVSGLWTNSGYTVTGMASLGSGFESVTNRLNAWIFSNIYLRVAVSTSNATVYSAVTEITVLDFWAGGYGLYGTNAVSTADPDGDGLDNGTEFSLGTSPASTDTDADGMPDNWEVSNGLNPIFADAALDSDFDDLSNLSEYGLGTDPFDADTDHDGMPDGWEVGFTLNPLATNALSDADSDGRLDLYEFAMGGDPTNGLDLGIAPAYSVVQAGGTNYLDFIYARRTNAVGLAYRLELTDDQVAGTWTNSGYVVTGMADLVSGFESVTNRLDAWSSSNIYLRVAVSTSNATVYSAVTGITPMDVWAGSYGLYGTNAVLTADPDGDGLDNAAELGAGTNPALSDTDGDSFNDGLEMANGGNPLVSDLWRVDYIRSHGADYDLYSSNAVLDISLGEAAFVVSGGTAWLGLQLEKSEDLTTWTNAGDEVIWSIPVGTSNAFYRVRSSR